MAKGDVTGLTVFGILVLFGSSAFFVAVGAGKAISEGAPLWAALLTIGFYLAVALAAIYTRLERQNLPSESGDYPCDDPNVHPHFSDWEH